MTSLGRNRPSGGTVPRAATSSTINTVPANLDQPLFERAMTCLIDRRRADKYRNNVEAIRLPDRSVPPPLIRPVGHWSHSAGSTSFSTILASCPAPGKVACPGKTLDLPWLPRFRTGPVFQSPFPTSVILQCPAPSLAPVTLSQGGVVHPELSSGLNCTRQSPLALQNS